MSTSNNNSVDIEPGGRLSGSIRAPRDRSVSHRSIIPASLAAGGVSRISGFLEGEDSLATLKAFQQVGVEISGPEAGLVMFPGVGMHGLEPPVAPLDLGNSGTSTPPMKRVTDPLTPIGAVVETAERGTVPLRIASINRPRGIDYRLPTAAAQAKSCLLLAGFGDPIRVAIREGEGM